MQIALNVNRTRITVLGFNLALLFFLTGNLLSLAHHHEVRALWVFFPSFAHIAMGLPLTVAAILMILSSQRFDESGSVDLMWFSSGELLMYLALAQTLSGGLQLFVGGFALTFRVVPAELAVAPPAASEIVRLGLHLTSCVHALAAIVWFGVTYVVPAAFLVRIPLARRPKLGLVAGYAVVLLVVCWISSDAYLAHARARGESVSRVGMFVRQLSQPRLWQDASLLETALPGGSLEDSE